MTPKICDFGWATKVGNMKVSPKTFCGTYEYMAPEIFENEKQTQKVDIWSLGILLYEMHLGKSPFSNPNIKGP